MKAQSYCVKCKAEKPMADAKETTLKNGRKAIKGRCTTCDTGMFKIIGQGKSSKPARTAARTETEPLEPTGLLGGGWTLLG